MKQKTKWNEKWFYAAKESLIIIDENGLITQVNQARVDTTLTQKLEEKWCEIGADYFALLYEHGHPNELIKAKSILNIELEVFEKAQLFPRKDGELQ